MTKEEIALKNGLCKCDEAYIKRGLSAPDCPWHSYCVSEAMDEYAQEQVRNVTAEIAALNEQRAKFDMRILEGRGKFNWVGLIDGVSIGIFIGILIHHFIK